MVKNYTYVEGLAQLVNEKLKPAGFKGDFFIKDFRDPGAVHCDYCGAALRYKWYSVTDESNEEDFVFEEAFGIGSTCAGHVAKYVNISQSQLDKAIKFFGKYKALCKEAKTDQAVLLKISELDGKIRELKRTIDAKRRQKREEERGQQAELYKQICKVALTGNGFAESLKDWYDSGRSLTPKQVAAFKRMVEREPLNSTHVKETAQQREIDLRADRALLNKLDGVSMWSKHREFIDSIANRVFVQNRPLSQRQLDYARSIVDRYRRQIAQPEVQVH